MEHKEILKNKATGRIQGRSRRLLDFHSGAGTTFQLCVSVQRSEDILTGLCGVNKLSLLGQVIILLNKLWPGMGQGHAVQTWLT